MERAECIVVRDVAVKFKVYHERRAHLRKAVIDTIRGKSGYDILWALDDVSFTLHDGDILGVVGFNGAGKSTLCLLLSGIIRPDRGTVRVHGRLSTLLGLGAGFIKDLSGRDNIYLNGAFLGFSKKEIDKRMDDIIAFAELEEFIDSPIRHYSSGMIARLGFAVAASIDPEILIIDEVLGVGDEAFKTKCEHRMREMIEKAKAIVIVSHSSELVTNLCNKALWLHKGKAMAFGEAGEVVEQYRAFQKQFGQKRVPLGPAAAFGEAGEVVEQYRAFQKQFGQKRVPLGPAALR